MASNKKIDQATGVETTGHVWDGDLEELNKPLPKWWLYVLYASIVWSIGYWIAYPAWPTLAGYTTGYLGYSQRKVVTTDIAEHNMEQARYVSSIGSKPLAEIAADPQLLSFAQAGGAAIFASHCAACHGRGAQGFPGYPNLNDDDWIWGGTLDAIHQTISYGVRAGIKQTRDTAMPRFGIENFLTASQISDTAHYVRSLSKLPNVDGDAAAKGKATFDEQCASCHGPEGKGNQEIGAPNLTDSIWLYGSEQETVVQSIRTGRGGMMPSWSGKLPPETIKMLAVYVHSLGGGKK